MFTFILNHLPIYFRACREFLRYICGYILAYYYLNIYYDPYYVNCDITLLRYNSYYYRCYNTRYDPEIRAIIPLKTDNTDSVFVFLTIGRHCPKQRTALCSAPDFALHEWRDRPTMVEHHNAF
jgi:hypothetical protein